MDSDGNGGVGGGSGIAGLVLDPSNEAGKFVPT